MALQRRYFALFLRRGTDDEFVDVDISGLLDRIRNSVRDRCRIERQFVSASGHVGPDLIVRYRIDEIGIDKTRRDHRDADRWTGFLSQPIS